MKTFLSFVRKEFYHIFRDTRTMMILLAMPVILIVLFGFAITTEVKNIRVMVVDLSHDDITRQITERYRNNSYFDLVATSQHMDDVERVFNSSNADIAVVFGSNFAENLLHTGEASVQLLVDGSEPNQASTRTGYAQQVLMQYAQEMMAQRGVKPGYQINVNTRMLYNPQLKGEYNFVPGIIGMILMLVCAMMTSVAIVREKESGTMEVLLASPLKPITIILAKLVPYFLVSIVDLGIILVLSKYLLHMPFAGSLPAFLGVSLLYILVALSLGLLISTLANSQLVAMLISLLLVIPVIYFSGMAFPIESMPEVFQRVSAIMPARWYVSATRKLMVQGTEVKYVAQETLILVEMAAVLITVSLASFKKRL